VIAFLVWATYWTWDAAIESMEKGERRFGGNEIPMWPAKLFIPVGFGGMALEYVAHAVGAIRALKGGHVPTAPLAVDPGSVL
jgi:TRAP-type mannitol/chloroaromatic compound transport system permease small subunit